MLALVPSVLLKEVADVSKLVTLVAKLPVLLLIAVCRLVIAALVDRSTQLATLVNELLMLVTDVATLV